MNLPVNVLVLCTANSARSQIAEAILRARGEGRIEVESAGTEPAPDVHPGALGVLAEPGIGVRGARPKGIDDVLDRAWDLVITVCDHARDTCPTLPGHPATAHWGVEDPAGAADEAAAFARAFDVLSDRIDRFLAIPFGDLAPDELVWLAREVGGEDREQG